MKEVNRNCAIRLPTELHRQAKLAAYEDGETLQEWIRFLIERELRWREMDHEYLINQLSGFP